VQLYRLGDRGPAVADVQATLVGLGLLPARPVGAVFDEDTDRALRQFQQERGLSVDGIVGPESYRALAAARWRLGDRLLSLATRPFVGDDVAALQERLLELGFDAGRADGVFGRAPSGPCAGCSASTAWSPTAPAARRRCGRCASSGARSRAVARRSCARPRSCTARRGAARQGRRVDPGHGGRDRGPRHGLRRLPSSRTSPRGWRAA
jgi:N-acetylmuramoyl-L-alanine amidase